MEERRIWIHFLMEYNFLVLATLFLIPGVIVYILRKDLRLVIIKMGIVSIPFAFTEFLFYPSYWEPRFLFDLARVIGFGIEDILFVIGLAAFTTCSFPFLHRKKFISINNDNPQNQKDRIFRLTFYLVFVFIMIVLFYFIELEMIYGSVLIMVLLGCLMSIRRLDLLLPGILGGFYSMVTYSILSTILLFIYPNIFLETWNLEKFSNQFILGIPLEELLYGYSSGFAATIFYPKVWNLTFVPIVSDDHKAY